MLTMGLTGKMLTNYVGDGRLTKFGVRFTNQVWPGDTLESKATVAALREEGGKHYVDLTLSTTNQDGKEVIRAGNRRRRSVNITTNVMAGMIPAMTANQSLK